MYNTIFNRECQKFHKEIVMETNHVVQAKSITR